MSLGVGDWGFAICYRDLISSTNLVELLLLLHMRISDMALADPQDSTFQNRVSFDTFDNKDAIDFSLTLNVKHKDYAYTRRSRTFLCGTDQNDYSEFALEWLIDELVDDGDEIVCLRVVDKDSKIISDSSLEEGRYRLEAKKLLDQIIEKNTENKAISVILEFAVGKVQETIQRMVSVLSSFMSHHDHAGLERFLGNPNTCISMGF
jgi:hypothetical protein